MIQIKDNVIRNLEDIANKHAEKLYALVKGRSKKHCPNDNTVTFISDNVKEILSAKPDRLLELHNEFQELLLNNGLQNNIAFINKVFSYNYFINSKRYNAYELAKVLNVNVCVYCNRQYTFTVQSNKLNIIRPQFDHFFSQEKYPLLSLSFYNLIPCCSLCNSSLKRTKVFELHTHFHPYLEGFNDVMRFSFKGNSIAAYEGLEDNYVVDVIFDETSAEVEKVKRNAEDFKLVQIYGKHTDQIREIVRKYHISGGDYIERLANMFNLSLNDQEEMYILAFGNYSHPEKYELRPLSKFTHDIYRDVFIAKKGNN